MKMHPRRVPDRKIILIREKGVRQSGRTPKRTAYPRLAKDHSPVRTGQRGARKAGARPGGRVTGAALGRGDGPGQTAPGGRKSVLSSGRRFMALALF